MYHIFLQKKSFDIYIRVKQIESEEERSAPALSTAPFRFLHLQLEGGTPQRTDISRARLRAHVSVARRVPSTPPSLRSLSTDCLGPGAHSVTAQFECWPAPPGRCAQQGAHLAWHLPSGCVCQTNKSGAHLSCVHCVHHNREQTRRRGRGGGRGRRCLEGIGVVGRATVHCATATIGGPRTIG